MSEPSILWGAGKDPIVANCTAQYTTFAVDANKMPIPPGSFNTLKLTIFDTVTQAIINGVQGADILTPGNPRGTTILTDSLGNTVITLQLLTSDNAPFYAGRGREIRSLQFDYTFGASGVGSHTAEYEIIVPPEI